MFCQSRYTIYPLTRHRDRYSIIFETSCSIYRALSIYSHCIILIATVTFDRLMRNLSGSCKYYSLTGGYLFFAAKIFLHS